MLIKFLVIYYKLNICLSLQLYFKSLHNTQKLQSLAIICTLIRSRESKQGNKNAHAISIDREIELVKLRARHRQCTEANPLPISCTNVSASVTHATEFTCV